MITNSTLQALDRVQEERLELTKKKNSDYSGIVDNIGICGMKGIAVRAFDKASRLYSLIMSGRSGQVVDETIEDTLKDLANYAEYGILLLRGEWECPDETRSRS